MSSLKANEQEISPPLLLNRTPYYSVGEKYIYHIGK
jgi:hypothetical protein